MNTISRALMLTALVCVTLASCSSTQRELMAGTRMKLRSYEHLNVGVLPVRVNPVYDSPQLKLDEIQKAVRDELHEATPINAKLIDASELDPGKLGGVSTEFPLTPGQLAKIGQRLGFDAVIGVNILAWAPPTGIHRARTSLVIAFAQSEQANAGTGVESHRDRWVLSSTWKSPRIEGLPQALQTELDGQFRELNRWLKSGFLGFQTEHGAPDDPILTFFSPASDTPITEHFTSEKNLEIVLTAIDDDGIQSLTVENPGAQYVWSAPAAPMSSAAQSGDASSSPLPVFISAPLTIPLAYGSNAIELTATDKNGNVTRRPISWHSTSRQGLQLLGIGIEHQPKASKQAVGAVDAVNNFAKARRGFFASEPDLILDRDARPARVHKTLRDASNVLGQDDEFLIVLAGRGGVNRDDPYLSLYSTDSSVPSNLSLSDLAALVGDVRTLVVMDLCTDAQYLGEGKVALGHALDAIERTYKANNVTRFHVAAQLSDCKKKDSFGKLVASLTPNLRAVRREPFKTDALYASLRTEPGLIAVAQSSPFKFLPGDGVAQRFWAVATSSADVQEAKNASARLKTSGFPDSEVLLGINGAYSVTLGSGDSMKVSELLREYRKNAQTKELGYVLDGEKIKQIAK